MKKVVCLLFAVLLCGVGCEGGGGDKKTDVSGKWIDENGNIFYFTQDGNSVSGSVDAAAGPNYTLTGTADDGIVSIRVITDIDPNNQSVFNGVVDGGTITGTISIREDLSSPTHEFPMTLHRQ